MPEVGGEELKEILLSRFSTSGMSFRGVCHGGHGDAEHIWGTQLTWVESMLETGKYWSPSFTGNFLSASHSNMKLVDSTNPLQGKRKPLD